RALTLPSPAKSGRGGASAWRRRKPDGLSRRYVNAIAASLGEGLGRGWQPVRPRPSTPRPQLAARRRRNSGGLLGGVGRLPGGPVERPDAALGQQRRQTRAARLASRL